MLRPTLRSLTDRHRVVVCAGCGGVGKTTITASLGLAAAQRGRRVLCLTIDPARRLANALGLERMDTEAQTISADLLADAGVRGPGSLTAMMLDPKRTFDGLVERYAPSPAMRDRILANPIYAHLSARLVGTQEYMAMEKVLEVQHDPAFDLIVVDTPPTSHALDFLDAPERLVAALDSPMARWFSQAYGTSGHLRLNLVARSAALALRGVARLMGSGFVEQVAEFMIELDSLFGGFKSRAREVAATFRSDAFAYVLVTSPAPDSISEVLFFAERLAALGLRRDAVVINRLHRSPPDAAASAEVIAALRRWRIAPDADKNDLASRVCRAVSEEQRNAQQDQEALAALDRLFQSSAGAAPLRVEIPALPSDVHDLNTLAGIAALL